MGQALLAELMALWMQSSMFKSWRMNCCRALDIMEKTWRISYSSRTMTPSTPPRGLRIGSKLIILSSSAGLLSHQTSILWSVGGWEFTLLDNVRVHLDMLL